MSHNKIVLYGFFFTLISVILVLGILFFEQWSHYIEAATIIGAFSGLFKLIYESSKTRLIKEAEFIANLNRDFVSNEQICQLYKKLEHDYRKQNDHSEINEDDVLSFVIYFTFFETLNDFIKKRIIRIKNIDDLFGYRFFIMVNNPTIQELELLNPNIKSSYVNIFNLYNKWLRYRTKVCRKNNQKITDSVVLWNHNLFERSNDIFSLLHIKENNTTISKASFLDFLKIILIQNRTHKYEYSRPVIEQLRKLEKNKNLTSQEIKKNQKNMFVKSHIFELCEMFLHKNLFVKKAAFGLEGYIGVIPVKKRKYLLKYTEHPEATLVIDTVVVDTPFRGFHIQKDLIEYIKANYLQKYSHLIATIDPNNKKSQLNFSSSKFNQVAKNIQMYHHRIRDVYSFSSEHLL
ncbi:MAG: hypothetical protein AB7U79_04545 [Candidatus Izemoplasmatales bacterium]